MILLDVNILVYAHREDAERHVEFKNWLESAMTAPGGVAVSDLVLSGCLRVITHPKVLKIRHRSTKRWNSSRISALGTK